jgi:hypothetical protein
MKEISLSEERPFAQGSRKGLILDEYLRDADIIFCIWIPWMVYGSGVCSGKGREVRKPWIFKWPYMSDLWIWRDGGRSVSEPLQGKSYFAVHSFRDSCHSVGRNYGYLLEKIFHARWWDYTQMPLNIGGYVCLLFSLIWGVACVLIVDFIHPVFLRGFRWFPKTFGTVLLVIALLAIFADLYVTASSILKMKKRLEKMYEIAEELHWISGEIGVNIYESVMDTLDKQQEWKEKSQDISKEISEDITKRI